MYIPVYKLQSDKYF